MSNNYEEKLTVEFLDSDNQPVAIVGVTNSIDDWTSVNIERDFFVPADGGTIVIEDDRIDQLRSVLQNGMKLKISINNNPIMYGYIFKFNIRVSRDSGTSLTIQFKDLLEYMAQGTCPPNMGYNSQTNFHFNATDTLQTILKRVVDVFNAEIGKLPNQDIQIKVDDTPYMTTATGFGFGLRYSGKRPKAYARSLSKALNHITSPQKGESYLSYILRLVKHIGADIKMAPGSDNVIIVQSPSYESNFEFKLNHFLSKQGYLNGAGCSSNENNVHDIEWEYNLDDQHSVVVLEMNTSGDGKFYQNNLKAVAVNEIIGYNINNSTELIGGKLEVHAFGHLVLPGYPTNRPDGPSINPLPQVESFIKQTTTGNLGTGYKYCEPKQILYRQTVEFFQQTKVQTKVCLPKYAVDPNAHTADELVAGAAKLLAEEQDKFLVVKCTADGWTYPGNIGGQTKQIIWYPNNICFLSDETVLGKGGIPFSGARFWIRKVNWIKNRNQGTKSIITLTLPYTHPGEVSP